jgi:hypothetical protein
MKNKKNIIAIILIIALNGLALASWLYLFSYLGEKSDFIKGQQEKISINDKRFENSNSLRSSVNEITDKKQKIDLVFLDKENIVGFIEKLESLAGKTGSSIEIGNISESQEKNGLSVQFALTGEFSKLFQYLSFLENLPYLVDVSSVNFKKESAKQWEADFEILVSGFI